jgi:hypothetical protein
MKLIGLSASGTEVVEMTVLELDALMALVGGVATSGLTATGDFGAAVAESRRRPHAEVPGRGQPKTKRHAGGGEKRPERNKKCAVCKMAFYDDTRTNVRKFCGTGGCKRDGPGGLRRSGTDTDPVASVRGAARKQAASDVER